jgi:glyoxylase-like metal-dependent hydrolase (beta-lactamase superfamily II)
VIFRQLFHHLTSSFTYLFARRTGGDAVLVDPLPSELDLYLKIAAQLEVPIRYGIATHSHGGQTALAELRERTGCETIMGPDDEGEVEGVTRRIVDGEWLQIDRMMIQAFHTPGHTPDSACFVLNDRAFTGDTLLIRSTGRTDLEGGDPLAQWDSLREKLWWLADHVLVYPAHDYKGWTSSTIAEERGYNPRLQVSTAEEYAALMASVAIDDPDLMDLPQPDGPPYGLEPRDG